MKLQELKIPGLKPRNPNQDVLASKRNAGGPMRDKKQEQKRGVEKHRKPILPVQESAAKPVMYQVRIESERGTAGDWEDIELHATSLGDIAKSVSAHPMDTESTNKFSLHELTDIVEKWIGEGPNSRGSNRGTWDEMDFAVKSHKDDVLKIEWHFGGVDMSRLESGPKGQKYGTPISRSGVITIMPAAEGVKEEVAKPPVEEGAKSKETSASLAAVMKKYGANADNPHLLKMLQAAYIAGMKDAKK